MKELLNKEFGPFDGKTWLIVIVGGLGLGYLIRRRLNANAPTETETGSDPQSFGIVGTTTPRVITAGGTDYNQGAIVADVLATIGPRLPQGTTDPTNVNNGWPDGVVPSDLVRQFKDELTRLGMDPATYPDQIYPVLKSLGPERVRALSDGEIRV